ncbi:MAG TPA: CDP-alcohol phosphatidyltransferase family protein, partial [Gaiellaceae bacterium]|nr:CDP-alcohol phosphatidyltransferase family protein [Gaiellaceae bacterium]
MAAVLLQVKTVLDNADGQLARVSCRVTLAGRYLDTEADLVVNAALFAALGYTTGQPWLALAAFLGLTLVLAVDYNVSELYREVRGVGRSVPAASGGRIEGILREIYRVLFEPMDRLVTRYSARRLERTLAGEPASEAVTLAYN